MLNYILWAALGCSIALNIGLIKVGKELKKRVLAVEKNERDRIRNNH